LSREAGAMTRLIAAALAALALAGCAGMLGPAGPASTADGPAVAAAVSAERRAAGLPAVALDGALTRAAAMQAAAMAARGAISHDAGGSLRARLTAAGLTGVPAAENVGRGHRSLEAALASWRASPAHARNLRHPDATRIGVARADAPGGPYWALVLSGDPRPGQVWR
jgi:uncharacterized protein YkwD